MSYSTLMSNKKTALQQRNRILSSLHLQERSNSMPTSLVRATFTGSLCCSCDCRDGMIKTPERDSPNFSTSSNLKHWRTGHHPVVSIHLRPSHHTQRPSWQRQKIPSSVQEWSHSRDNSHKALFSSSTMLDLVHRMWSSLLLPMLQFNNTSHNTHTASKRKELLSLGIESE